jgi:hypothetical protein
MKRIIRGIVVSAFCVLPNCATFVASTPRITRIIENYNCRKGYSACRQHVVVEVVRAYQD